MEVSERVLLSFLTEEKISSKNSSDIDTAIPFKITWSKTDHYFESRVDLSG